MSTGGDAPMPQDHSTMPDESAGGGRLPPGQRVAHEELLVDWRVVELDMSQLRVAFLGLMDRAMKVVEAAGWSPDDVICERRLRCVVNGGAHWECEATSLVDADWLRRTMNASAVAAGVVAEDLANVRVVALNCHCHAEGWPERGEAGTRDG